ncbi:agmatinase [Spirochaetia bacterium 38H-sp]|uniref:Agmatinase n=1 Tax=Rarispira pelagica TaxID=3141764 RepID=A0ABU9UA28_9SPIR
MAYTCNYTLNLGALCIVEQSHSPVGLVLLMIASYFFFILLIFDETMFARLVMPHFLYTETDNAPIEKALFSVIPVPYEKTVSYGAGTAAAPGAIIEASGQLEAWDGRSIPSDRGINTQEEVRASEPEEMIELVSERIKLCFSHSSVPVVIGGEHSVSCGVWKAIAETYGAGEIGIVQIDAHADLRDSYQGTRYSHACAIRRACDYDFSVYQAGVRSISYDEVLFRKSYPNIKWADAQDIRRKRASLDIDELFPDKVYITIDVDGFDPSVFRETGTPEPGGLMWYEVLFFIERIARSREIVGFDVVELAPHRGSHVEAFAAARLIHDIMGIIVRSKKTI